MFEFMTKRVKGFVDMFVPGLGMTKIPFEELPEHMGSVNASVTGYKSIKEIRAAAKKRQIKPVFILSKSKIFKKRVGRIIYGKEGENIFL